MQRTHDRQYSHLLVHPIRDKEHLLLRHPFRLLARLPGTINDQALLDRNPGHLYSLHHRPDESEATGFCGEGINLIGALAHIAQKAFDRIGRLDGAMHHLGKA